MASFVVAVMGLGVFWGEEDGGWYVLFKKKIVLMENL